MNKKTPTAVHMAILRLRGLGYLAATSSLLVTMMYWYMLAGSPTEFSPLTAVSWSLLIIGAVLEFTKKSSAAYGYVSLWLLTTAISVITVMGTMSIMNQSNQDKLSRATDEYKDARVSKKDAEAQLSKYAWAAGLDIEKIQTQMADNKNLRDRRKISYAKYKSAKDSLWNNLHAARSYIAAKASVDTASQNMGMTNSRSSTNPLMDYVASAFDAGSQTVLLVFYLVVNLIAEYIVMWTSGVIRRIKTLWGIDDVMDPITGAPSPTKRSKRAKSAKKRAKKRAKKKSRSTAPEIDPGEVLAIQSALNAGEITGSINSIRTYKYKGKTRGYRVATMIHAMLK